MKRAGGKAGFTGSRLARLRLLASPCHQQRVHLVGDVCRLRVRKACCCQQAAVVAQRQQVVPVLVNVRLQQVHVCVCWLLHSHAMLNTMGCARQPCATRLHKPHLEVC